VYKIITVIGLVCSLVGTIITFLKLLTTQKNSVGTWAALYNARTEFVKEQKLVCVGLALIVVGTILQAVGTIIS
jgi:hypothetical protein